MFTGIIEALGEIKELQREGTNLHLRVSSPISNELKIDQSIAHNGVCLTVVEKDSETHVVTAVEETLKKSNLGELAVGSPLNLERCMKMDGRLDGHIVQGHVDTTAVCTLKEFRDGSWNFRFEYEPTDPAYITVGKGSICINGVSLTVVDSGKGFFSVTIIPYTYDHTNFNSFEVGTRVNLEFDILGKYVARLMEERK